MLWVKWEGVETSAPKKGSGRWSRRTKSSTDSDNVLWREDDDEEIFSTPSDVKLRAIVYPIKWTRASWICDETFFFVFTSTKFGMEMSGTMEECESRQSINARAPHVHSVRFCFAFFRWRGVGGSCDTARHVYTLLSERSSSSSFESLIVRGIHRNESRRLLFVKKIRNKKRSEQ